MKQFKLFAVALAALTLFSCQKQTNADNSANNAPGSEATLTISVTGQGNVSQRSKVTGDAGATDVVVSDYIVFVFRDGGLLDCPAYHSKVASTSSIAATTAANKVYVVANTGDLATGLFNAVKNETDLQAVFGDLQLADQNKDKLWMSGQEVVTFGTGVDANKGTSTVEMGFVTARITLKVIDNRTNKTGGGSTISDKAVSLLFAGKKGLFFGTVDQKTAQTEFYSGDASYPNPSTSTLWAAGLNDDIANQYSAGDNGIVNHFYTFGNDGKVSPTIIVIRSIRTVGGVDQPASYYPVIFSDKDVKQTIIPGKSYSVTITLNGDITGGGGGGTIDPEDPIITSNVAITVTPATWDPVVVNKEFK